MLAYEEIDLFDDDISLSSLGKKDEDRKEIINQFEDGTLVVGVQQIKKRLGTSPGANTAKNIQDRGSPRL
jgi:hypothetical protein